MTQRGCVGFSSRISVRQTRGRGGKNLKFIPIKDISHSSCEMNYVGRKGKEVVKTAEAVLNVLPVKTDNEVMQGKH